MKQGTNLHVITWSHTIHCRQVRFRSPTMLSIYLVFLALVALKLLVSLVSRLVACSPRIVVDTHTHTHTDTYVHTERLLATVTLAAHARRGLMKLRH